MLTPFRLRTPPVTRLCTPLLKFTSPATVSASPAFITMWPLVCVVKRPATAMLVPCQTRLVPTPSTSRSPVIDIAPAGKVSEAKKRRWPYWRFGLSFAFATAMSV